MTSAERAAHTDELIVESEQLRRALLAEVDRLESFVLALQEAVDQKEGRRHD